MEKFQRTPVPEGANNDDLVDAMATLFGITFAPEPPAAPPERKWPAKLVARRGAIAPRLDGEDGRLFLSTSNMLDGNDGLAAAEELARRWNRCEELEQEIEEGWRRSAQIDREIADGQERRIDALLGELAERTRERDWARRGRHDYRVQAEALLAERDELRRRCELGAERGEVFARLWASGTGRLLREGPAEDDQRPVPGEGGGDA